MKQQYMKQVKKELAVTRKQKKEIMRDLDEVFSSALEHGESEKEVIERLGLPKEFVLNFEEQSNNHKQSVIACIIAFVISIISFVLYRVIQVQQPPSGAIGHADAMTNIKIEGLSTIDWPQIILIVGIVAFSVVFFLVCRLVYKNKFK